MSNFKQHIHYNVRDLSLEEKRDLLKKAFDNKYNWWVDKLDCRESCARQKIDMSFDKIMEHLTEKAFVTLIHRMSHSKRDPDYLEIGFSSMESPIDYFLWIHVSLSKKEEFIKNIKRLT